MYDEIKEIILNELKQDRVFRQTLIKTLFEDEEIKLFVRQSLQ